MRENQGFMVGKRMSTENYYSDKDEVNTRQGGPIFGQGYSSSKRNKRVFSEVREENS